MSKVLNECKFVGRYVEQFANGKDRSHFGNYYVTELKTRYLVSFKPFDFEFPLFVDFCILKKKTRGFSVVTDWIDSNWN